MNLLDRLKGTFSKQNNPLHNFAVVGVAGTRGKSFTAHALANIFVEAELKTALISSEGVFLNNQLSPDFHFDAQKFTVKDLSSFISYLNENQFEVLVLEVTTANLIQNKYQGIVFDSGIITNIAHDHTEKYEDWEDYAKNKLKFLNQFRDEALLIANALQPEHVEWLENNADSLKSSIYVKWLNDSNIEYSEDPKYKMIRLTINNEPYYTKINAPYLLQNLSQSIELANFYKLPREKIYNSVGKYTGLPGRLETILDKPYKIILDKAVNPEMLNYSLSHLKEGKSGRIITVMGAKGHWDKNKRYMGGIAAVNSDVLIVCADDPNHESVYDINNNLIAAAEESGGVLVERVNSDEEYQMLDKQNLKKRIENVISKFDVPIVAFDNDEYTGRVNAIHLAISLAKEGDLIYINGKGNDSTIVFKDTEFTWSDKDVVNSILMGKS